MTSNNSASQPASQPNKSLPFNLATFETIKIERKRLADVLTAWRKAFPSLTDEEFQRFIRDINPPQ